ncbi:Putative prophage phiRv2 integrase [bacterium HR29]|nr:Putative prophage phiRv2 integrase [bacterium HR29]
MRRHSKGHWEASVTIGGRRYWVTAKTKRELTERLEELRRRAALRTLTPPQRISLRQWVERWLAEKQLRPSSRRRYETALRPFLGRLGGLRLDRLQPAHLAFALSELREEGVGPRTLSLGFSYLRQALKVAVRLGLIGSNPAYRVDPPAYRPSRRRTWSEEELGRFLAAVRASRSRYAPLILFLVGTGCRLGEALALRWGGVDLARGTVRIERSKTWVGRAPVVEAPKTPAGNRVVHLTQLAREALDRLPRSISPEAEVFPGASPWGLRSAMAALCRRAGVPLLSRHDLRHAHAAVLLAAGVPITEVAQRLGHASPAVTASVYAHALRSDKAAARAFDVALREAAL